MERKIHRMKCPNCRHEYWYDGRPYEAEHCPLCPYAGKFDEFVLRIIDTVKAGENYGLHKQ